ncbi:hypothetical protein QPK87_18730 [Kamptonema cortianum]|nr:hypothetical protein [Geitlerinema splendidum]MDK3158592.1 hypothetical protein [Kamptonema cortianum]
MFMALSVLLAVNDTYFAGQGGSATALGSMTEVRMIDADIRVKVPTCEVTVTYTFKNEGAATTVTMGFPEEGIDSYLDGGRKTWFKKFESLVDGKLVSVTAVKDDDPDRESYGYKVWWTKKVEFAPGQTRKVVNRYISQPGSDTSPRKFLQYITRTAQTWMGDIKKLRIEFDCSGLPAKTRYAAVPHPHKRTNDTLKWFWENFEPTEDHDVLVAWEPSPGFYDKDFADPKEILGGEVFRRGG